MWRLCGSNRPCAAEPEFGSLAPLGSPPQSKPAHREREQSLKEKCWHHEGIQDGIWVGTCVVETTSRRVLGSELDISLARWDSVIQRLHEQGAWNKSYPNRVWECPCRVEAEWPSPAVYIAYWIWLSATRDISMGLDSAKVLLKVRKQPKERSHSIALIICWRVVKGLCELCPGEWGSTFQAQHKLVSVTACSSGSGWLLGRWQPYISSIPSAPPTWLQ